MRGRFQMFIWRVQDHHVNLDSSAGFLASDNQTLPKAATIVRQQRSRRAATQSASERRLDKATDKLFPVP
jgi:hypothetical protein